jgi:hypothetical protein
VKNLLIPGLLIAGLTLFACTSVHQVNSLDKLTNKEIAAYNSNPNNTDKIVCTNEASIGTRVPKRICRKESSIDDRTQADQQTVRKIQSGVLTRPIKSGG